MNLANLLGNISVSNFLADNFLKLPLATSGPARPYCHLGDWEKVESLLDSPNVDRLVASQRLGIFQGQAPATLSDVDNLLRQGYTLGFRHVQNNDAALFEVARAFEQDFLAPVDIHLYCTPAGEPGFGWHYDAEEVFVVQTCGSKAWSLRKNTVNPWPIVETLPQDMAYQKEVMPLMRCELRTGDWLYIPAGYWHSTVATEDSVSLSIGINCRSGIDVYDSLRAELLQDIRWRQRLPLFGGTAQLSDEERKIAYRAHLDGLAEDLMRRLKADDRHPLTAALATATTASARQHQSEPSSFTSLL